MSNMKKIIIFIIISSVLTGCKGYFGGLDDSNVAFSQFVIINKSSHDIDLVIRETDWFPQDTIHVEPHDGLWKHTVEYADTIYDYNMGLKWAKVIFDGKESFVYDSQSSSSLSFNPCWNAVTYLSDSKGCFHVLEYSDETYDKIKRSHEEMKKFNMFSISPSSIHSDSLITEGSSEALFDRIYPVPAVWDDLKLGAVVSKEAEKLDEIIFRKDKSVVPDTSWVSDERHHYNPRYYIPVAAYYCMADLEKMGLAHFGCDFAALTGRKDGEMEKFCGVMYTHPDIDRSEYFFVPQDLSEEELNGFIAGRKEDEAVITEIDYGRLMILLAEADYSYYRIGNYVELELIMDRDYSDYLYIEDIDFYLLTRNEEGGFECRKGGWELVEEFKNCDKDEPVLPLAFRLNDFSEKPAYLHIQDVMTGE